jgi:DMSO/TMAO reductase YedYZ heme-binding membrane subunit
MPIPKTNNWKTILLFSFTTIPIFSFYYINTAYEYVSPIEFVLKGFTNTGYMLIGCSLLLGPLAKFYNIFDPFLHYRKQLGIVGFYYILLHGIVGTALYIFPTPWVLWEKFTAIVLGLIGLYLLFICTAISEIWVIQKLGPKIWRRCIRYLSYTAFILGTIHIFLAKYEVWQEFLLSQNRIFPPISMVMVGFGIIVLSLRFWVFIYDGFDLGHKTLRSVFVQDIEPEKKL